MRVYLLYMSEFANLKVFVSEFQWLDRVNFEGCQRMPVEHFLIEMQFVKGSKIILFSSINDSIIISYLDLSNLLHYLKLFHLDLI